MPAARDATPVVFAPEAAPQPQACPAEVGPGVRCLGGRDSAGAYYLIALPAGWTAQQGRLVLHAHGGPFLGEPTMARITEDLKRWALVPRAGYAWAGSSFRQGGVAVRAAAEDTERLRQLFVQHVGKPALTVLHGQSWGAGVAAKGAETYTAGKPYDGVLLTSGLLAGGTRSYDFRLDLRVVYQHLCNNHPRPDEPAYPLWQGLPADSPLTAAELTRRVNDCLGTGKPAAQRSAEQARRLKTIVDVIRIPEGSVAGHLNWATFHFRDIALNRTGGGNVFGNRGVQYRGSADDTALNAQVQRYAADPAAVARFADDTDPGGRIPVPVLTVHGIGDATVFVEVQHHFAQTMAAAGRADALVQTYVDQSAHSYLGDAPYAALLAALERWVVHGDKPTPPGVAAACEAVRTQFPSECRFRPDYPVQPLESRVPARLRP
nr:hypothetical protein [Pseudorhodoferax sp.]